jgi:hypothetical protein
MLFAPGDPSRQARNWEEHAAILRAVVDGDERLAANLATEHVMRAGYDYLLAASGLEADVSAFEASDVNSYGGRGGHVAPPPKNRRGKRAT